ncbi:glycosyltransferase [Candidatus Dojkabacteria bacterium]|nr:glycosyltransferase [Candidatus Dojkabacteria bacterium]
MQMKNNNIFLSVVIPIRNESKNLPELHSRLLSVCKNIGKKYEIIYVENASTDNSLQVLKTLPEAKIVVMRWAPYMKRAQSLAMDAGFKQAKGDYIIYMDGDLQVDPEEIPRFIEKLEQGYDVVCGWRQKRKETLTPDLMLPIKAILRGTYTIFRKMLINEGVHDPGSALKAFRKETLQHIDLYGEMHRFIVALLHWRGFKIAEIKIKHHPRKYGHSNYTLAKGFKGFADLINVFIWRKYSDRPLHLFGVGGLFVFIFGCMGLSTLLVLRALNLMSLKDSIFPILFVLTIMTGLQLFLSGLLADSMSRLMYANPQSKPYSIKEIIETTQTD